MATHSQLYPRRDPYHGLGETSGWVVSTRIALSCNILDEAPAAFWGGISIESPDDDGLRAVPRSPHVLLKADQFFVSRQPIDHQGPNYASWHYATISGRSACLNSPHWFTLPPKKLIESAVGLDRNI